MITPDIHDQTFLAWAGAWLDTEGSIGMRIGVNNRHRGSETKQFRVTLTVAQKDPVPLYLLRSAFGGCISGPRKSGATYNLKIHSLAAVVMLRLVYPYLVVKTKQADLAIRAGEIVSNQRGGRGVHRPQGQVDLLESIKNSLHKLNGWSDERRKNISEKNKGRAGPRPIGRWSKNHNACIECGRTDSPHIGRGLCNACYARLWRSTHANKLRNKVSLSPRFEGFDSSVHLENVKV